ncbi:YncE family protein [Mycobacterium sp. 1245111.1]|uniref:YncE family protein n=1 Tax=Mycobacterium sp. 1245111.1 TaxID=1834073 RepID=UPI000A842E8A|nr:YncE family protein [Mycobacterium sp. 1245111.1]
MSDAAPELSEAKGFTAVREIAVGRGAVSGIAVSSDGGVLAVTHHGDDSVSLVHTNDATATLTVTEVDEPFAVAMSGRRAYVSSVAEGHDEVLVFDTGSEHIIGAYPVAFSITDLAVSSNGRYVYATRSGADGADVAILDTATGNKKSVGIAATTVGCARVSQDGRRLYVAANGVSTAELVAIDTRRGRITGTVEIGSPIRDIALSPDGGIAYVASCGPDFGTVLDVVDTRNSAINATYKIGDAAQMLAQLTLSRSGERAYLVGDQYVTVLSTTTQDVLGSITVGDQPSCAIESPDGERLYIGDYAGTVTVLEIAANASPEALTSDDDWTAPRGWSFSELRTLEPTPV